MTDQSTTSRQQPGSTMGSTLQNFDQKQAQALLREASIDRQTQTGNLSPDQQENIRLGRQDQAIGFEDAVYALTHVEKVWDKAQAQMGKQS